MANKDLNNAKKAKKDEFYTQLDDIASELRHYKPLFAGKTVLCNCDDPYESNFFKFFALCFNSWRLRKLVCTCYGGSPMAWRELPLFGAEPAEPARAARRIEITEMKDLNGDGATDLRDVELMLRQSPPPLLEGDGDFRSPECVRLLEEADIVVTNPPFSLFREYVAQLVRHGKKFLIIGPQNAITYKEVFPLIMENKLWLGYGFKGGAAHFISNYQDVATAGNHREGMIRVSGVTWFTNLDHNKRHENLVLYKKYTPEEFPRYDNYDAIEVPRTADIPADYDGVMGVPITFLNKYNPGQFEILGATESEGKGFSNGLIHSGSAVKQALVGAVECSSASSSAGIRIPGHPRYDRPYLNGDRLYFRIFIRNRRAGARCL